MKPTPAHQTLVVVPAEALAELIETAVAAGLEARACALPEPLLDRAGVGRALDVSTATIDRLVRVGMPCVLVAEARRFELPAVLEWLRTRSNTP
jgi:hypothetical protein